MSADSQRAKSIFLSAADRPPGEPRSAYLAEACGSDADLRREVEELLAHFDRVGGFLESPGDLPTVTASPPAEAAGEVIGRYKLVEPIGEGGMGEVWLAQQTEPVKRLVALKVIKAGMDTKAVLARFEAERQALALMDHPNIAKVLDGGATPSGRPYFVMELVKGTPITKYCDEHRLTPRQRLELFVQVCQAVQHAHQKGIIHRDLKPSNVLVAPYDSKPVVKVIDFGVAKAAGVPLTEKTLVTGFGAVVGTPEYMSPEQAELNNADIDTRSDVYSLGILLYELLTGSTPLTSQRAKEAALVEVLRVIREEDPPRPSNRLSTTEKLPSIAASRGLEPKKLSALVRGELDWIVMKALEKDRTRRYETANGFGVDLQHYLAGEPVQAHPPSTGYRVRKFVRRNKGPVLAASLVLLALLGGMLGTTLGLVEARRQRKTAEDAVAAEAEAKRTAQTRAGELRAVLDFTMNRVFAAGRPKGVDGGLGRDVRLADAVRAALPHVGADLKDQPLSEAYLRRTLGISFLDLGNLEAAVKQLETAGPLFARHLGPDHPAALDNQTALALSYHHVGRYTDALNLNRHTLERRQAVIGPDHIDTLGSKNNLAMDLEALGRRDEAVKLWQEALAVLQPRDPEHEFTLNCMGNLANCYAAMGRHEDALKLREDSLARARAKFGPDGAETISRIVNLADSMRSLGRPDEARKLLEGVLPRSTATFGPDHPVTLACLNSLSITYRVLGRRADECKTFQESLSGHTDGYGPNHSETLAVMHNLAMSHAALGHEAEAVKLLEEAVSRMRESAPEHRDRLHSLDVLATRRAAAGRQPDALKLAEEARALLGTRPGRRSLEDYGSLVNFAILYAQCGQRGEAIRLLEEILPAMRDAAPDHLFTLNCMSNLGTYYLEAGRPAEAVKLLKEVRPILKNRHGPDQYETVINLFNLADALVAAGRGAEAVPVIDEFVRRAGGKPVPPFLVPKALHLRLQICEKQRDAAGCRATAEMWEKLNLTDAEALYNAACMRAVTAGVLRGADMSGKATKDADAEGDRAMAWLKRAMAAGFGDVAHVREDTDLHSLRARDDFKKLMSDLEAKKK